MERIHCETYRALAMFLILQKKLRARFLELDSKKAKVIPIKKGGDK